MQEQWKTISGYKDYYEISDRGNVRSLDRVIPHERFGTCKRKGVELKKTDSGYGYFKVSLFCEGNLDSRFVHKLVADAFLPPRSIGFQCVRHKNSVRTDNSATNLEWCAFYDGPNYDIETEKDGKKSPHYPFCKLTEDDVYEIRSLWSAGRSCSDLSKKFNISMSNVSQITNRKTWKHLEERDAN